MNATTAHCEVVEIVLTAKAGAHLDHVKMDALRVAIAEGVPVRAIHNGRPYTVNQSDLRAAVKEGA